MSATTETRALHADAAARAYLGDNVVKDVVVRLADSLGIGVFAGVGHVGNLGGKREDSEARRGRLVLKRALWLLFRETKGSVRGCKATWDV